MKEQIIKELKKMKIANMDLVMEAIEDYSENYLEDLSRKIERHKNRDYVCVTIRDFDQLLSLANTPNARRYLSDSIRRQIDISDLICIEIYKVNRLSWQICQVVTESDSCSLEDENIILNAPAFNTAKLRNTKPIVVFNELLGFDIELEIKEGEQL